LAKLLTTTFVSSFFLATLLLNPLFQLPGGYIAIGFHLICFLQIIFAKKEIVIGFMGAASLVKRLLIALTTIEPGSDLMRWLFGTQMPPPDTAVEPR
jgi:ABC-type uncharacterized transport system permease subunit